MFTWDKKVETYLKKVESTISGQGKMPTIVSPEVYRARFINAIDRYVLEVPDQWYEDHSRSAHMHNAHHAHHQNNNNNNNTTTNSSQNTNANVNGQTSLSSNNNHNDDPNQA